VPETGRYLISSTAVKSLKNIASSVLDSQVTLIVPELVEKVTQLTMVRENQGSGMK